MHRLYLNFDDYKIGKDVANTLDFNNQNFKSLISLNNETLMEASIREATNVRNNVGIWDVSSLGKIEIKGPECPEF